MSAHARRVALDFAAAVNERDVDALVSRMTEDHLFVDSLGRSTRGREAMRAAWEGYYRRFPDYSVSIDEVVAQGNMVALFGTARGTHAAAPPPSPESAFEIPAAWQAVVRGDHVAEWRVYADNSPVVAILERAKR
jgi:ketosteroid isomerase-like protein